jgi:glucose-6-phosphate 1-dehydrogenase
VVELTRPPHLLFDDVTSAPPNHFRFRLSPHVVIELGARAKRPGEAMVGESVALDACHEDGTEMLPYERLLSDAMHGDQMLFARADAVEDAWRVVQPVIGDRSERSPIRLYEPGSWGPAEADEIAHGGPWRNPTAVDPAVPTVPRP